MEAGVNIKRVSSVRGANEHNDVTVSPYGSGASDCEEIDSPNEIGKSSLLT